MRFNRNSPREHGWLTGHTLPKLLQVLGLLIHWGAQQAIVAEVNWYGKSLCAYRVEDGGFIILILAELWYLR